MKLFKRETFLGSRLMWIWEHLVEPAWVGDARERHLSRVLNVILLGLVAKRLGKNRVYAGDISDRVQSS